MARETHKIDKFVAGVVSSPSLSDTPDDSAQFSSNVEPFDEVGKLKGRREDEDYDTGVNGSSFALINDSDGLTDVIYFNPSADHIRSITDFHGTPVKADIGAITTSLNTVAMQRTNMEVHIGVGQTEDDKPRWVGYIPHEQFGSEVSGIQEEDAELIPPSEFPPMYKIVKDVTYIYGIQWLGNYIYRFNSDGTFDKRLPQYFQSTQGLALGRNSSNNYLNYADDDSYLWVLDGGDGANGALKLVKRLNGFIEQKNPLSTGPNASHFSDIIEVGDGSSGGPYTIWISEWSGDYVDRPTSLLSISGGSYPALWNITTPTSDGTATIVERTPLTNAATTGDGAWRKVSDSSAVVPSVWAPKVSLSKIWADEARVNWMVLVGQFGDFDIEVDGGASFYDDGWYLISTKYDTTAKNLTAATYGIRATCKYHRIPDDGTANGLYNYNWSAMDILLCGGELNDGSLPVMHFTFEDVSAGNLATGHIDQVNNGITFGDENGTILGMTVTSNGQITSASWASTDWSEPWLIYYADDLVGGMAKRSSNFTNSGAFVATQAPDVTINSEAISGTDPSGAKQWYRMSFMYDGYQEGPLSPASVVESDDHQDITIRIYDVPRRVTHLNIYKASSSTTSDNPETFYRLLTSMRLDPEFVSLTDSLWGSYERGEYKDEDNLGASYDALVGISETLTDFTPHYSLSAVTDGSQYIGICWHPQIDDATHYIFKSKVGKYDQYDWSNDYLIMPERPTAMYGFNGRLYIWSANNMYRVNPQGMYIEDVYEGIGCLSNSAVVTTDFGMLFADANNIFLYDGTRPAPIGDAIKRMQSSIIQVGWQDMTHSAGVHSLFDSVNNAFVVLAEKSNAGYAFVYTLNLKRWDIWTIDDMSGAFTGADGVVYASDGTNLQSIATSSTRERFAWYGKQLNMAGGTREKRFRRIRIEYSGTAPTSTDLYIDGVAAGLTLNADHTVAGKLLVYDIDASDMEGYNAYWYLRGAVDGTTEIDAVSIIYGVGPVR